jgi:hypothetical protein
MRSRSTYTSEVRCLGLHRLHSRRRFNPCQGIKATIEYATQEGECPRRLVRHGSMCLVQAESEVEETSVNNNWLHSVLCEDVYLQLQCHGMPWLEMRDVKSTHPRRPDDDCYLERTLLQSNDASSLLNSTLCVVMYYLVVTFATQRHFGRKLLLLLPYGVYARHDLRSPSA